MNRKQIEGLKIDELGDFANLTQEAREGYNLAVRTFNRRVDKLLKRSK